MLLKVLGAVLIVAGCGGVGFRIAANHRREECSLRQLICALDFMECELQYRLTPLPQLCRLTAKEFVQLPIFEALALELESQISADMERCMASALRRVKNVPHETEQALLQLGKSLGRFDLQGQLRGFEAVRQECRRNLEYLGNNRENRLRSYKTLGLCAGAALAILFI